MTMNDQPSDEADELPIRARFEISDLEGYEHPVKLTVELTPVPDLNINLLMDGRGGFENTVWMSLDKARALHAYLGAALAGVDAYQRSFRADG